MHFFGKIVVNICKLAFLSFFGGSPEPKKTSRFEKPVSHTGGGGSFIPEPVVWEGLKQCLAKMAEFRLPRDGTFNPPPAGVGDSGHSIRNGPKSMPFGQIFKKMRRLLTD